MKRQNLITQRYINAIPYDFNVNNKYCLIKSKLFYLSTCNNFSAQPWQPAETKLKPGGQRKIDVNKVLPEYQDPYGAW
jgi:hypothetical protein